MVDTSNRRTGMLARRVLLLAQVELADAQVTKPDLDDAVDGGWPQRHRLTGQGVADAPGRPPDLDASGCVYHAHRVAGGVGDRRQVLGEGAWAARVAAEWGGEPERLVGALLVVDGAEAVEDALGLAERGEPAGADGVGEQRAVDALELALSLGMEGTAVDRGDAEPNQKDAQFGQPVRALRCAPGRAVVAQQLPRQAVAAEERGQDRLDRGGVLVGAGGKPEQEARVVVEHRQGVAAPRSQRDVAGEVDLPQPIRRVRLEALPGAGDRLREIAAPSARADGGDRADCGQVVRAKVLQAALELARPPGRVGVPQRHDLLFHGRVGAMRAGVGAARTVDQRRRVVAGLGPRQPRVAGGAADPITLTQRAGPPSRGQRQRAERTTGTWLALSHGMLGLHSGPSMPWLSANHVP